MRIKALKELERPKPLEIRLATLPDTVLMTDYAREKAFMLGQLVTRVHGEAFEWYAFTLAKRTSPEVILDVGLPVNAENQETYVSLSPEGIAAFQEGLPPHLLINGWLHSHGDMDFRQFSETDANNQATVLDYVTSQLKLPVAKKEVLIRDLNLVVWAGGDLSEPDPGFLTAGSVTLCTDVPVGRARLLETVYGGFCYAIVIGNEGWTRQEIHYKTRGVLTGETHITKKEADLIILESGRRLTSDEIHTLELEVRERLRPVTYVPEKLERV
uniref:JAB domain-containing protein n=1 Tax=Desulfobacca acetoxidans TaxID=60893 RepID=A0A7C5AKY1_9BACT